MEAGGRGEPPRRHEPEEGHMRAMVGADAADSGWDLGGDSVPGDEDQDHGRRASCPRLPLPQLTVPGGAELCRRGMIFISSR
jgi:hypothetical protein